MSVQDNDNIHVNENAIAIIGMSCRFPGAMSVERYWENLLSGIESIDVEINFDGKIHAHSEIPNIENFDYEFFGFSYKEAQLLDPQHRILLECAWEVIEKTDLHAHAETIGVFCGAGPSSYFINNILTHHQHSKISSLYQTSEGLSQLMATDKEFIANRIAYKLNCCGPAVNIQAACATSMFAIQAAIQSLLLGDCDAALVGAAAVSVPQSTPYYYEPGMPFSSDGHCRPFDVNASGTVFGSGGAVICIKRLEDAIADENTIQAVIRSTATNNDGALRAGMSAPSVSGQTRVIKDAFDIGGVSPDEINYIEAHGTATAIGDPIEIKALANIFKYREKNNVCYIGSVKGNIGHLGWASGMAGLIKAVLIAQHKIIPPTINFQEYNPQLFIEETPFSINKQSIEITSKKAVIGISSFGLGGNNSHIVIESYPEEPHKNITRKSERMQILPLSAQTRNALQDLAALYANFLESIKDEDFTDFVSNITHLKSTFSEREFVVASNRQEAIIKLRKLSLKTHENKIKAYGLMFSGQGGEHINMGKSLYTNEPFFKNELNKFDSVCQESFGYKIEDLLFNDKYNKLIKSDIKISQPLIYAIEVSMSRFLLDTTPSPSCVFGHSLGEYAAACIAGVFSHDQGFRILVERSRLLDSIGNIGSMISLQCDKDSVDSIIKKHDFNISIAALNSIKNTVVSGAFCDIDSLINVALKEGIKVTRLNISRPGHSYLLDPILDEFEIFLNTIEFHQPLTPFVSTVSGGVINDEVATSNYWRRQLRDTVNFKDAIDSVFNTGCNLLIEIGPKALLSAMILSSSESRFNVLPMAKGGGNDQKQYLTVLGELFRSGFDVEIKKRISKRPEMKGLPNYPFQRVRCWIDPLVEKSIGNDYSYVTVWEELKLDNIDNRMSMEQSVIYISPIDIDNTDITFLKKRFKNFHEIDISHFAINKSEISYENHECFSQFLSNNLNEIEFPIDRVYFDLRYIISVDYKTAINVCYQTLNLIKYVVSTYNAPPNICILLTTEIQPDLSKNLNPVANSILGLIRSILVEEPLLKIKILNFMRDEHSSKNNESSPIEILPIVDDLVFSIYNNKVYVPRLEKKNTDLVTSNKFCNDTCYFLIGGAGGIGRVLIKQLCADGAKDIYVLGRTKDPNKELCNIIAVYPFVKYLGYDLTTTNGVNNFCDFMKSTEIKKISIFNLAVCLKDKLYKDVNITDLVESFDSKFSAVHNLYSIVCDLKISIEFIFNFSSATSILGNGGQISYGSASAFIDTAGSVLFPYSQRTYSVNWGVWDDAGKLQYDNKRTQLLKFTGISSHKSNEAILYIKGLLSEGASSTAFMNIEPDALYKRSNFLSCFLVKLLSADNNDSVHKRKALSLNMMDSSDGAGSEIVLQKWIVETIDSLVGLDTLACDFELIKDRDFRKLGFDSLAFVQLKNAMLAELGLMWSIAELQVIESLNDFHTCLYEQINEKVLQENTIYVNTDVVSTDIISVQQSRWISLINKGYGLRIIPYLVHCKFDSKNCLAALSQVVDENKLLRTYFPEGRPVVKRTSEVLSSFGVLSSDFSASTTQEKKIAISDMVKKMTMKLSKPEKDITWTIHFIDIGDSFFIALLGVQHLEFDGKSLTIFFDRLGECLYALSSNTMIKPLSHKTDYSDYAQRQFEYIKESESDISFFKGLYSAYEKTTVLPLHSGFSSTKIYPSLRHTIEYPELNSLLSGVAKGNGVSVFNIILYAYATTMSKVTGSNQLIISAINSGRGLSEFNQIIGPFTSPLPIPITINNDCILGVKSLSQTLNLIQDFPLMHPTMLIKHIPAFSGMTEDTYFSDIGINFLNYRHAVQALNKVNIEGIEILGPVTSEILCGANISEMARIPGLHLVVEINGDNLRFNFWYHRHRFTADQVGNWGDIFIRNLENFLRSTINE